MRAARLVAAGDVWGTSLNAPDFNVQSAIYSSGTLGSSHPYRLLYKQFRVKKIIAYIRFVNAPNSLQWAHADPTDTNAIGNQFYPFHWELFVRASNQNDALVTNELKLASDKVSVTNDGRQYKFSVIPMVNYQLQVVKGDTQVPVSNNVKYYKPAGWMIWMIILRISIRFWII